MSGIDVVCTCAVRYAAAIGEYSLDMAQEYSRIEAYKESYRENGGTKKMDAEYVYIPETDCFNVVSIVQGIIL